MKKLILGCCLIPMVLSTVCAWEIPPQVNDLIIGPYVAQNNATFKKVSVKTGEECLVYSDGTSIVIMEDRGQEILVKLNTSLVFRNKFDDEKGNKPRINLYEEFSSRDNDLCPRGTMILLDKADLRELHDIKSLYVEAYALAEKSEISAAERRSIGIPEQVKDLNLGYYTAQNSTHNYKNFVNAGEECAVIAKGSALHVYSRSADGMMGVRYQADLVFMYNDRDEVSQKVNHYTLFKKHNSDLCPDGTRLAIPLDVLNEWNASKQVRITWEIENT